MTRRYRHNPYGRDLLEAMLQKAADPSASADDLTDIYDTFVEDEGRGAATRIREVLARNPVLVERILLKMAATDPKSALHNPLFPLLSIMGQAAPALNNVFEAYKDKYQQQAETNYQRLVADVKKKVNKVLADIYVHTFPADTGAEPTFLRPGYVGFSAITYMDKKGAPEIEQNATAMVAYVIGLFLVSLAGGPSFQPDGLALHYAKPYSKIWVKDLEPYLKRPQ